MIIRKVLLLMVSLLLAATAFSSILPIGIVEGDDSPLATTVEIHSDYTVSSGQIKGLDNVDWLMKANIRVYTGGTLYINNSFIKWDCESDGQYGLYVSSGASLHITGTNFTVNDTTTKHDRGTSPPSPYSNSWTIAYGYHWKFDVEGNLWVDRSDLNYLWGNNGYTVADVAGGIQVFSTPTHTVNITNTKIINSENAGISIMDRTGSTTGGCNVYVDNVIVSNCTATGIIGVGSGAQPTVLNSVFVGNGYKGGNFYYGAGSNGRMDNCKFLNNKYFGFSFDPINAGFSMVIRNSTFSENEMSGFTARRDGSTRLINCVFTNNGEFGVDIKWETATTDTYKPQVIVEGGRISNNGMGGVGSFWEESDSQLIDVEISWNGGHGVWARTSQMTLDVIGCNIHDNQKYGVYFDSALGSINGNKVYNNPSGGIYVQEDSSPSIANNIVNNTNVGIELNQSRSQVFSNNIFDCDTGILVHGESNPTVSFNNVHNNMIGMDISSSEITINSNNYTDNSNIGLFLDKADQTKIRMCSFDGNDIGLQIEGGDYTDIRNITFHYHTTTGIMALDRANITLMESKFTGNTKDITLDGASRGSIIEDSIPISMVDIIDTESEFWQFWRVSIIVADNVTYDPIEEAQVKIIASTMDVIFDKMTASDGSAMEYVPSFKKIGQTTYDFNPINISVSKPGYVPLWEPGRDFNANIEETKLMSENRAPEFPLNAETTPKETHQKRPTLEWTEAFDWNMDIMKYRVNIYMDELYSEDHLVVDRIVDQPIYTLEKNIRFNRFYWVEVEAMDPWGKTDTIIFTFKTINNAPTVPEIAWRSTPVSTRDDIEVMITNQSTDMDVDPLDQISYLVEWYALRENSWVLISSGINQTLLPSDKTNEEELVKVVVKPYDGIEYGDSIELEILVVNFVPEVLQYGVEVELEEDVEDIDIVDLKKFFTDRDGDEISFRVVSERHVLATIDQVTNNVTLISDPDWSGFDQVIIEGFDTKQHQEDWPRLVINVTVNKVNDAPRIDYINDKPVGLGETILVQGIQGSTIVISVSASDADELYGDEFEFSTDFLDVMPEGTVPEDDFLFEANSGRLSVFLSNTLVGSTIFNITATDLDGAESTVRINLLVENKNDPPSNPVITSPSDGASLVQGLKEDGTKDKILFTAEECDDPDLHIPESSERLTYAWDFGDNSPVLENAGTAVSHEFRVTGEFLVTLTVEDSMGLQRSSQIKIKVEVTEVNPVIIDSGGDTTFMEEYGLILILVIVGIIFLAIVLLFILRRDPLSDVAAEEEKEHETLVARQQQDALEAQEKLQAILSGTAYGGASGPALPAAGSEGELAALPTPTEPIPEQQPPMEGYPAEPQHSYDQAAYPEQPAQAYQEPPAYDQAAYPEQPPMEQPVAPAPVQPPMQAAPMGTVPQPEAPPQAQNNLPAPEEQ